MDLNGMRTADAPQASDRTVPAIVTYMLIGESGGEVTALEYAVQGSTLTLIAPDEDGPPVIITASRV